MIMLAILTMITLVSPIGAFRIDGSFDFCDMENALLVDFETASNKIKTIGDVKLYDVTVLHKLHNNVYGYGYKCTRTNTIYEFKTDLFNNPIIHKESHDVSLSSNDCWEMVRYNKCESNIMECEGKKCYAEFTPQPEFRWLNTKISRGYKCSYETVLIQCATKFIRKNIF